MPEFLPTPQMPTGLADETLRLAAARGENSPWAALAKAAAQIGNTAGQATLDKRKLLTPEQQVAMGLTSPAPGPAQPGQPAPTMSMPAFNKGMPMSLAENMLQRKTQEDVSRETTSRIMGAQGLRDKEKNTEDMVPLTAETRATLKKRGIVLPDSIQSVHRSLLAAETKPAPTGGAGSGIQMDKFVQTEMDKANKAVNPLNATRGTALGNAGMMLTRIGTAKETLADPNITPQQLAAVTTDLAGIVQMGTPHELGIKDQDYSTWWTKANALAGRIKNKPEEAQSPETVKKLKELVNGYEKVYNGLVQKNLDAHKKSVQSIAKKYPDYKSSYDALEKDIREKYPLDQGSDSNFDDLYKKHGLQ